MDTQEPKVSDAEKVVRLQRRLLKMAIITIIAVLGAGIIVSMVLLKATQFDELCQYKIKIAVNAAKTEEVQPKCDCPVSVTVDGGFCQLIDGQCWTITTLKSRDNNHIIAQ